jgi:hypothetical protein
MKKLILLLFFCATSVLAQNPLTYQSSSTGNITATGSTCATSNACISVHLPPGSTSVAVTVTGTWSATLVVEMAADNGVTWVSAGTGPSANGQTTYTLTAQTDFRVRCSAFTSGTVGVFINVAPPTIVNLGPISSSGGGAVGSIFSVLNYGWVDDDSTDNCGTPVTSFLAAVNGYTGPGLAQVIIPEGPAGKAYKLATCNLIFTAPRTLYLWGTIDCAQSSAFANCIQEGPSNLVAFTNAQTPPYTIDGTGVLTGCLNVTVACIEAELWVSNPRIKNIHLANVGAGNATLGSCTNYAVSFDGHNNAPQMIGTEYWNTDSTTGRCWSINNRLVSGGGTNTALIAHNTIIGAGNAPGGFLTPCGSVGHTEQGSATMIYDNQFYGFGQPILLLNPQTNTDIRGDLIDQAGCVTGVASADIHFGNASNGAVVGVSVVDNFFPGGSGHATNALARSTGSTSAISAVQFTANRTSVGNVKGIIPNSTPCTNCSIFTNPQFEIGTTCSVTGAGAGATCSLLVGLDSAGVVAINTGTSPSALGTLTITANTGGSQFGSLICAVTLHENATSWNARATIITASSTFNTRTFNWDNNAVGLTASTANALAVDYICSKY